VRSSLFACQMAGGILRMGLGKGWGFSRTLMDHTGRTRNVHGWKLLTLLLETGMRCHLWLFGHPRPRHRTGAVCTVLEALQYGWRRQELLGVGNLEYMPHLGTCFLGWLYCKIFLLGAISSKPPLVPAESYTDRQ
jgi:hypothetical protein